MKQYTYESREEYVDAQVERSQHKFDFCKVYFSDIFRYREIIDWDMKKRKKDLMKSPNILCLGVRSGAEVDMFRSVFHSRLTRNAWVQKQIVINDATKIGKEKIKLAKRWGKWGGDKNKGKIWGVEINPEAVREDIWIGSFDEMPNQWSNRFDILYSNSFDHSMAPEKVVAEWKRVCAPGAYVILGFTLEKDATFSDPLGGLDFKEMNLLWQSELVFATETMNFNGYKEICYRLN